MYECVCEQNANHVRSCTMAEKCMLRARFLVGELRISCKNSNEKNRMINNFYSEHNIKKSGLERRMDEKQRGPFKKSLFLRLLPSFNFLKEDADSDIRLQITLNWLIQIIFYNRRGEKVSHV